AVRSYLDLRPLAGHDPARLGRHRSRPRALTAADVASCLQHRLVRAGKPVALLHRDAADRLTNAVLDNADAQRLQLAVELTGDQPLAQQLRRSDRIVREGSVKIGCCAAAVGDENTAARSSNAAAPRLASRPGLDTHEASELSRCTMMGTSQQTYALGQP